MSGEKVVNTFGWHDQEVVGAGLPDKRIHPGSPTFLFR